MDTTSKTLQTNDLAALRLRAEGLLHGITPGPWQPLVDFARDLLAALTVEVAEREAAQQQCAEAERAAAILEAHVAVLEDQIAEMSCCQHEGEGQCPKS
jgi:hypothetical protein